MDEDECEWHKICRMSRTDGGIHFLLCFCLFRPFVTTQVGAVHLGHEVFFVLPLGNVLCPENLWAFPASRQPLVEFVKNKGECPGAKWEEQKGG
jgi:hypothetical protein